MCKVYESSRTREEKSGKNIALKKSLWSFGIVMLFVFTLSITLSRISWAQTGQPHDQFNRPHPLMDYAPQEIGIYDTSYENLTESDCRSCHGNSLAERHHATPKVVEKRKCTVCHQVTSSGAVVTGISLIRDCTTIGCHSSQDLDTNGWHHDTEASGTSNCVACHSPNLIAEITPVRDLSLYPPSVVTPTPYSCENCHYPQALSNGHPSTQDHFNEHGENIGDYEYGKPVAANIDTHHMGGQGNLMSNNCSICHSQNPYNISWDPFNPEYIRYCEACHSIETLHRIGPHVQNTNGWRALGFHTDVVDPDDPATDLDPTQYGPFTADQQCFGCHADLIDVALPPPPVTPEEDPEIDNTEGIQPTHGCCGTIVTLRGQYFGEQKGSGYKVQLETEPDVWTDMPIHAWTDTLIEFEIPCWTLETGNYDVRVVTPKGISNHKVFTVDDCIPPDLTLSPAQGPVGTVITISSDPAAPGGFGDSRSQMYDDYHGVCRIVDFIASQGTYTALDYQDLTWSNKSFDVKFYTFFKDSADPDTGQRNYVQDIDEPAIVKASGLAVGKWAVYVKYIFFGDNDLSDTLSAGDTIFQVVTSDPMNFELTKAPIIYRLTPTRINGGSTVQIYGLNFGPTQGSGEVHIGTWGDAENPDLGQGVLLTTIRGWSSTVIKVRMNDLPPEWANSYKYIWVEKGGKGNYKKIKLLSIH